MGKNSHLHIAINRQDSTDCFRKSSKKSSTAIARESETGIRALTDVLFKRLNSRLSRYGIFWRWDDRGEESPRLRREIAMAANAYPANQRFGTAVRKSSSSSHAAHKIVLAQAGGSDSTIGRSFSCEARSGGSTDRQGTPILVPGPRRRSRDRIGQLLRTHSSWEHDGPGHYPPWAVAPRPTGARSGRATCWLN